MASQQENRSQEELEGEKFISTLREGIVADIVNVAASSFRCVEFTDSAVEDWFLIFETACRLHTPKISVSETKFDQLFNLTVKNKLAFRIVRK